MCSHEPPCPAAEAPNRAEAIVVARDWLLGWARLCNGVYLWEDTGELLPDGVLVAPYQSSFATGAASCS
ncbi:DUF5999 family protein [Streptomyces sp. NPDC020607]|uniref:DUF5999 family protein n=1 Tax=Streptomyces sp. NPDC020607 TaxID=3365082 RepID=UPI00378959A7